ncbi:MAG: hypothetical protein IJJ26_07490, partial [Victivallales bacterium]|nr:hypothetical protein [Victivallales bacterium]
MKQCWQWFVCFCLVLTGVLSAEEPANGGNLRYSITVSKFENKANWSGRWDLGDAWGTILTDCLMQTKRFIVLGEKDMRGEAMLEQDLAASGRMAKGNKAPEVGQMTPAQLLVKGAITHVEADTAGGNRGIGFKGIRVGFGNSKTEINVTIYVVDSRTGQVKASKSVVGRAGKKGLSLGYHGNALHGLTGDMEEFAKDNMGQATIDAVNQTVEFLIGQLESIPWEGTVVSNAKGKIIINRGTREGVSAGMRFVVGKAEVITDPDTGEVLDRSVEKVATIVVDTVREKIAIGKVVDGD